MHHMPCAPLILPYEGVHPTLQGPLAHAEPGSAILGRVTLGPGAVLQAFATLRGDGHVIHAGAELFMGRHATVHIAHAVYGTAIGSRVSVGRNAVVHACTVGDDCVVQEDVCILDGASVGAGSVVAAGSVVFSRAVLPAGHWCEGAPAVPVRPIELEELRALHAALRSAEVPLLDEPTAAAPVPVAGHASAYLAATARCSAPVHLAEDASLWFGCVVQVQGGVIDGPGLHLAAGCNVQDNSVILTGPQGLHIGADCTVGHNVSLHDGRIGAQVLIGMGSVLAPGTVVQDRVLLAAGSRTAPGQVLESGWLWGGRTARAIARLDDRKLDLLRRSAVTYREYARGFAQSQAAAAIQT
jgi:carbonic anhydrase/acetyltransferase-like protein (isoleucine patch superfamily)